MDPLSVSASIAGLVTLADLVFRAALRYSKSVKEAAKEVKALLDEIKDLTLLLHNLSMVAYGLQMQPDPQNSATAPKPYHLHGCQQLLNRLEKGLSDFEAQSGLNKLQIRLKWPFTTSDTKEMLQAIGRHKQTITIALNADSLTKLHLCLSQQDETQKGIQVLKEQIRKVLDIEIQISLNKKRQKVLSTFTKVNSRLDFETNKELRHPMTALWLTEGPEFAEWISTNKARIWCSGIPGAGKSVIAGAIIDECLQRLLSSPKTSVCYFFCTYRNPETILPCNILSTLCSQLALQHESAYKILETYHEELHPPHQLPGQMKLPRLIKLLHEICGVFGRVYLIVDGLDECGENTRETVDSLSKVSLGAANKNINMALLSRDELLIRERVENDFHWIEIEAHTEDIQLYVASEMERLINENELRLKDLILKDEIMTKLVKGAKGMFRWVTCQLDHLCKLPTDGARRKALDHLPPTLPATYERILKNIDNESKQLVKTLLLLMLIEDDEFDSLAMCEVISIQENSDELDEDEIVDEQEILRRCGSLIRLLPHPKGHGKRFQFAHFTVQEFLKSDCSEYPILNSYGISLKQAKERLLLLALRYLTLKNFKQRPQADQEGVKSVLHMRKTRPFYKMASVCWWKYEPKEIDESVWDRLCTLFSLQKTPNFCRWAVEVVSQLSLPQQLDKSDDELQPDGILEVIYYTTRTSFTPLHMASALGWIDICQWLLQRGVKVDLMSRYGTPLHCAIGGLAVFNIEEAFGRGSRVFDLQTSSLKRRGTMEMLVKEGGQPNFHLNMPFKERSLLSLALAGSTDVNALEIVAYLIRHGIAVEKGDLEVFSDTYKFWMINKGTTYFKKRSNDGAPVLDVLDALTSIQPSGPRQMSAEVDTRPEVSLYDRTFDFAWRMGLDIPTILVKSTISGDIGSRGIPKLVISALGNDDTELLASIYLSEGSDHLRLFDPQLLGLSVLHAAVEHRSSDCLELLLGWGLDPNARDDVGLAPINMCYHYRDEDSLRVLLKNGSNSLALDNEGETVWHAIAGRGMNRMLQILIQQEERESALQIVSRCGDTPVCSALIHGHRESVELLLRFCHKREHWKCSEPIYRAAAKLGSAKVIQWIVEIGIQYDENDEAQGNPLHWISPQSDLQCIEILESLLSPDQRRELDSRTPFESLLLRIFAHTVPQGREVRLAIGLLSDHLVSSSKPLGALWSFWCAEVVPKIMLHGLPDEWLDKLFTALLEMGITSAYEESFGKSVLEPFAQCVCRYTIPRLGRLTSNDPMKNGLRRLRGWNWFSQNFHVIADHADLMANMSIMAQLLCEAILHDDQSLVELLLKLSADCHLRAGVITPFELACLPVASENEQVLRYLLDNTKPEHLSRDGSFKGLGPLHLTAGLRTWDRGRYTSMDKLRCLLDAGANPNLPSSDLSPMTYHISRDSMETAEALLDARADPWLRVSESFDSVLMSIRTRNCAFLTKVFSNSGLKEYPPQWNQVWTTSFRERNVFKANALHLAALFGQIDALEFYLGNNLLTDVNAQDGDGQTPMHYAARAGHAPVVPFLVERGGRINAKSNSGMTALNLAVQREHSDCVGALLVHGAGQQEGHVDHSPFVDAYYSGNETIINMLKAHFGDPSANSSIMNVKAERKMASSLMLAITHDDVDACQNLVDLGCHIDIEIAPGETPLMFAISERKGIPILQWLLDNNAKVSSISWNRLKGFCYPTFYAALTDPKFNPLIGRLVGKYLEEQRGFLAVNGNPLYVALAHGNTQGLIMLLNEIRNSHKYINLDTLLNPTPSETEPETPLHTAVQLNDLVAVKALVNAGADIDQRDYNDLSPLLIAAKNNAHLVAEYLICSGARLDQRSPFSQTPILMACVNDSSQVILLLLEGGANFNAVDGYGDNCLTLLTTPRATTRVFPRTAAFKALIDAGVNPFAKNNLGLDCARSVLISETSAFLCYLLNRFPDFFNNRSLAWGAVQLREKVVILPPCALFLSRHLRLICHFLTDEEFLDVADLSTPGKHTFFCTSVISGSVEAVRNFLKYGANIEHACPDHGTPFIAALTSHHLEIVKILFRSGAKPVTDAFRATGVPFTEYDEKTKRWLLVERYYEQPKLLDHGFNPDLVPTRRSGVVRVEVEMEWHWKRMWNESMLDYAKRRQSIIQTLKGTQVKVLRLI